MNLERTANSAGDIVARGTPIPRATQGTTDNLIEFLVDTLFEIRVAQCIARDLVTDIDVIAPSYEHHRAE